MKLKILGLYLLCLQSNLSVLHARAENAREDVTINDIEDGLEVYDRDDQTEQLKKSFPVTVVDKQGLYRFMMYVGQQCPTCHRPFEKSETVDAARDRYVRECLPEDVDRVFASDDHDVLMEDT